PRGQVRAKESAVGSLVGEAPDCAQTEIDGARRQMPRLQVDAISEDDGLAEREPRLRAVPLNEFLDRMPVSSLCVNRTEAVQNSRLRLVQVGQAQHCFWSAPFPLAQFLCHPLRPSLTADR